MWDQNVGQCFCIVEWTRQTFKRIYLYNTHDNFNHPQGFTNFMFIIRMPKQDYCCVTLSNEHDRNWTPWKQLKCNVCSESNFTRHWSKTKNPLPTLLVGHVRCSRNLNDCILGEMLGPFDRGFRVALMNPLKWPTLPASCSSVDSLGLTELSYIFILPGIRISIFLTRMCSKLTIFL